LKKRFWLEEIPVTPEPTTTRPGLYSI